MRSISSFSRICVVFVAACLAGACFGAGTEGEGDTGGSDDTGAITDGSSCDPACEAPSNADHVVSECRSGSCELRCEEGWSDSDDDLQNGCEVECTESNGGTEICDGEDNDCDGMVDEDYQTGDCTVGEGACEAQGTYVCASEDRAECDAEPGDPSDETCGDDVDNDCDGETDEADATDAETWYADSDGDGFGDASDTKEACEKPDGYVSNDKDCDDSDGMVKPRDFYPDQDEDGFTTDTAETKCRDSSAPTGYQKSKSSEVDCNDMDADVNPGAAEQCDGKDTNCDGDTDNISQNSSKGTEYYIDCDGDTFSPGTAGSIRACSKPSSGPSSCSSSNAAWTDRAPTNSSNTDCRDDAPKARPDQTNYFKNPIPNSGSNQNEWDYNCNGSADRRWDDTNCGGSSTSSCDAGFVYPYNVDCGQSGEFYSCVPGCCSGVTCTCFVCSDTTSMETEQCR